MKNVFNYSLFGLTAILTLACSKDLDNGSQQSDAVVPMEPCVLFATAEDSTKTHISSLGSSCATVVWDSGDAISLLSTDKGGNIKMVAQNISGSSATFSGEVVSGTTTFAAVYPYASGASYNSGTISGFSIPTTQTATAGSFANGAALSMAKGTKTPGKSEVGDLKFNNLCSVIGFTLPSNISFAKEITVTANNGGKIAGAVTVNYNTAAITAATATSITIKPSSGNFEGGKTYYVTIAPGTYTGGFSFSIKTASDNTYTRGTTKELPAVAGGIYKLGTLSLELGANHFTTSVAFQHTVLSSQLTGTDATLTIVPLSEFSQAIKSVELVSASMSQSSTVFRNFSGSADPRNGVKLEVQNSKPYLPKGSYQCSATIYYTIYNGTKDVRRGPLTVNATISQAVTPSGFAIDANLAGYTSYSCYKGDDGQSPSSVSNANNCDNATIYGIGASYKSGLSSDVYSQCSSMVSLSSTLDGTAKSGNQGSQSWASHTIGATWSFDGASGTCSSNKTVYVTGLPYNPTVQNMEKVKSDWTMGDDKEYKYEDEHLFMRGKNAGSKKTSVTFKGFYVPADIDVYVNYKLGKYGVTYTQTLVFIVGKNTLQNWSDKGGWSYRTSPNEATLTSSANTIYQSISGTSTSWGTGQSKLQHVAVKYR